MGDDDLMSMLPDDVVCYVLSFLSLRDAFRTRLLSRRWRFLCPFSFNLSFDFMSVFGLNCNSDKPFYETRFLMAVDQFLQSYTHERIDSFHVSFRLRDEDSASHLGAWLAFALRKNASSISLDLSFPRRLPYSFPFNLGETETSYLKHLHLNRCHFTPPPEHPKSFISLKTLQIRSVVLDQFGLDSILSACSNLEHFTLNNCFLPSSCLISGPHPYLASLLLHDCSLIRCKAGMSLELNSLEKLKTFEYISSEIPLKFINLPAVENVYLNFTFEMGNASTYVFTQLAKDFPKLTSLSVAFKKFKMHIPPNLESFKHLNRFEFSGTVYWDYDLLRFVNILNASPALEKFHLSLYFWDCEYETSRGLEVERPHMQLKEVELSGFSHKTNHVELIRYLIRNCISLKLVTVNVDKTRQGHFAPDRKAVLDMLQRERLPDSSVEIAIVVT